MALSRAGDVSGQSNAIIALGARRELFVDDALIENLTGAVLRLHKPAAHDVALVCDAPWEGNTSNYYTVFQDGELFRMYYRGSHWDERTKKGAHPEYTCYAESRDGIVFTKPNLGLYEFDGSRENNIVWADPVGAHNLTPFLDANPACAPEARYKALGRKKTLDRGNQKSTLHAFQSPDGLRWTMLEKPVITQGAFDSQNTAFWDAERGEYRAYWRYSESVGSDTSAGKRESVRAIRTATSKDFLHWENQAELRYGDAPPEHLYTNAVAPYFRAPQLFTGFPTRFHPETEQVEPLFMTSRNGVDFRRWEEALIPLTAPKDRDGNRSNYMAYGLLQLPGNDRELSVYATEAYYAGPGSRLRRFTFRIDGFVSVHAEKVGILVTKPFVFSGSRLTLNLVSRGPTRMEFQDENGKPLPGFRSGDCEPIQGDFTDAAVAWKGGALSQFCGKPSRLRFELNEADLYALQFQIRA